MVVLEKTSLRVRWTARRSNQSILKAINTEYSLEGLRLRLRYFGHLMLRADSLEKILMLGKIEGRRRRGQQDDTVGWHHWHQGLEFKTILGDSERQRRLSCCVSWGLEVGLNSDWTTNLMRIPFQFQNE